MKLSLLAALIVFLVSTPLRAIVIAHDGKTAYVIGLTEGATPVEQTAAQELKTYLDRVTGATFEIKTGATDHPVIAIRTDPAAEPDAISLKLDGNRILLSGGARGVLYAAHTFLEGVAGVRWWTSTEEHVPHRPTLEVAHLDVTHIPRIRYRENYNADVIGKNHVHATRLKLNGHHQNIPPAWGGHYTLLGWCHTSFHLVPPNQHFATHPEWYAERNGKRQTTQVCWSDQGLRREMTRRVLAQIRKNPDAGMISVSQEDTYGQCQCPKCAAIEQEDGSAMGPLLRGVNAIARAVEREYPDFLVETLAYQWSRKPPKITRPAKNVLIRLCSIEADFAHPLETQDFGRDLLEWSKIADHLFVWNYVTNFSNSLIPHPNLHSIGKDLRFFADNRVVGVFEQGDAFNYPIGDFLPMRVWVQAKLLWDPALNQRQLMTEFLDGYYGPAGNFLLQYLDLVNAPSADPNFRRGCFYRDPALSRTGLPRALKLFDQAADAVRGDAVLEQRLHVQRLILDHLSLLHYDFAAELKHKSPETVTREFDQQAARFISHATAAGARNFSESLGFSGYTSTLRGMSLSGVPQVMPPATDPLPDGVFDLQEARFHLHRKGALTEIREDPRASGGRAAWMKGGHTEWAVQLHVPKDSPFVGKGPWKCFVVIRVDAKARSGAAFTVGVYDPATHAYLGRRDVGLHEPGVGEYRGYGFIVDELRPGQMFWVSPGGNPAVDAIWVDRVLIRK